MRLIAQESFQCSEKRWTNIGNGTAGVRVLKTVTVGISKVFEIVLGWRGGVARPGWEPQEILEETRDNPQERVSERNRERTVGSVPHVLRGDPRYLPGAQFRAYRRVGCQWSPFRE